MNYLVYGANGYAGRLIVREALLRGQHPILAGRNAAALASQAKETGLEQRCFALDEPKAIDAAITGVGSVLHCAGPFSQTSKPMADACLRTGNHYIDITGEPDIFEVLSRRDAEAKAAGITLMPGVGFDVVPSDCLSAHLKRRLPSATHLTLAVRAAVDVSRGTASTMVENLFAGAIVREAGVITTIAAASRTREVDFGDATTRVVIVPWGDIASAFHSTGIPNIEFYAVMPGAMVAALRVSHYLKWALGSAPVQGFMKKRIQSMKAGPTDAQRGRGSSIFWGEARDDAGRSVVSRLRGPEGYTWTVLTALATMDRILAGDVPLGYRTPSMAYGPDFILGPGVIREDDPEVMTPTRQGDARPAALSV